VTADKIQLQLPQLGGIDVNIGQLAKAGVDSVDSAIFRNDILHDGSGSLDAFSCFI
jgi:hypothetical protein